MVSFIKYRLYFIINQFSPVIDIVLAQVLAVVGADYYTCEYFS
jgi:hypothetical protein